MKKQKAQSTDFSSVGCAFAVALWCDYLNFFLLGASANKKKFQKEQVAKTAKIYFGQLRREVNAEREKLGKTPIEDDKDRYKP